MTQRLLAALFLAAAAPAAAWEFTPTPICTLSDMSDAAEVTVTYEPQTGQYAIRLTLSGATWPEAPVFSIQFLPRGPAISTSRHELSDGGRTLTVTDTGFGNVLGGLEGNAVALALLGESAVEIPLDGAAPGVAAFRACPADRLS